MHQPKASLVGPLVPEHREVLVQHAPCHILEHLPVPLMSRVKQPWLLPGAEDSAGAVPVDAQLLRAHPITDKSGDSVAELAWGIPFDEEHFIAKAVEVGHPKLLPALLPAVLARAVDLNASMSVQQLATMRLDWFKHWSARAQALAADEKTLHQSFPPPRAAVLKGKKILLYEELLKHYEYPDPGVVALLRDGVDLEGEVPIAGVFPPCFKPAEKTPQQLVKEAPEICRSVLEEASRPSPLDAVIVEKTEEEARKGWVSGPLDPSALPSGSIINRRFAIVQKGKPRVIDDCSASRLNASVQKTESPKPQSADLLGSLCLALLEKLPPEPLEGKCVDLKSAYRQVPVSEASHKYSNIAYFDPSQNAPTVRCMYALPFGASRAVYGYLRIAYSLWWLAVKCLALLMTHFFDDFVTVCRKAESNMVSQVLDSFFKLLGWKVAEDKDCDFAAAFSALGIRVALDRLPEGVVTFANAQGRIEELSKSLGDLLRDRRATAKSIERLRGRMLFAGGQLFGRLAKLCVQALRSCEENGGEVTKDAGEAISLYLDLLEKGPARLINRLTAQPLYLFTDAAYEKSRGLPRCGLGGVLLDCNGAPLEFFSVELTDGRL